MRFNHCLVNGKVEGSKVGCAFAIDFKKKDGDSFMSDDVFGHLCTNYGSKWQLDGRQFAGGTQRLDCGTSPVLHQDFLTCEILAKNDLPGQTYKGLLTKAFTSAASPYHEYGLQQESQLMAFFVTTGGVRAGASDTINFPVEETHFSGTYDGSWIRIFRNGNGIAKTAKSGAVNDYGRPVLIGKYEHETASNSTIRRAQIYNLADYTPRILSRSIGG